MPELVEELRRRRFPALATCAVLVLMLVPACRDSIQEPGEDSPASVAVAATVAASHAGDAGLVAAFEAADSLEFALTRAADQGVLTERSLAFEAADGDVTELTTEVVLEEDRVDAHLELELLGGSDRLFQGRSPLTLEAGETVEVELELVPVAQTLELPDEPLLLTSLADSVDLHATMLFATGDSIGGVQPDWSSDDTSVVEVLADGTVVPRNSGQTLVRAAHTGSTDSVAATVDLGITWTQIDAGDRHTCGVAGDGTAYCWGANGFGQLGDGTTSFRSTPVEVSGGISFERVAAAEFHTCGLTTDGTAYCWGRNFDGALGNGTTSSGATSTPVQVAGGISWQQVVAGGEHSCGVATDGTAYCWGRNDDGQVGVGDTLDRSTPTEVAGGITWQRIDPTIFFTCGLATDGTAYCWGWNGRGQLGDGTTTDRLTPVQVVGGISWQQVSAGSGLHTCGVATDGTAYCWGANGAGQLGDGTTTSSTTPVQVSGGLTWQRLSPDGFFAPHTCGLDNDGLAWCWGGNSSGQLGDGTTTDRLTPVQVSGGISWQGVVAGWDEYTCGLATDGIAYCWGDNSSGQLGDGTTTGSLTPIRVANP